MSARVSAGKLNFAVQGRGYDDDRGNSGKGYPEPDNLGFSVTNAEFDSTGQYCWINRGNLNYQIYKYETDTWTRVSQGSAPSWYGNMYRPKNIETDLCVCARDQHAILLNLNTNEVVKSLNTTYYFGITGLYDVVYDEENNLFRFIGINKNRVNSFSIGTINLETLEGGQSSGTMYDRSLNGFIDDTHLFLKFPPEWFSQWWWAYSVNLNGSNEWAIQATDTDTHSFTKLGIDCWGLVGHGKMYLPSLVDGEWVMGEYSRTSTPDFLTPAPDKTYGHFSTRPTINNNLVYSVGKKHGAFSCAQGLFVVDMINGSMTKVTSTVETPIAMSDEKILCTSGKAYYF